jgi:4-methyl-5(b-hydroxyethyl)-thiazole monophosphate biosynthesis
MPKVLVPLAEGFEEIEALGVVDVLRRADIEVVIAGLLPGPIKSSRRISVNPDTTIDSASADEFDMIILPGGQPGTDNLNADSRIHTLLADFSGQGKLIGAICAAPSILAGVGLLKGKQATSHPTYSTRLCGAIYEDSAVVSDGNIITSQGAGTTISFALAIVSRLINSATAEKIAKAMVFRTSFNLEKAVSRDEHNDAT